MRELAIPNDCLRYSLLPLVTVLITRLFDPYHGSLILRAGQIVELLKAMMLGGNADQSLVQRPKQVLLKI